MKTEIEADFALLVQRNVGQAIQKYQELAGTDPKSDTNIHSALRAHWMLAGIYSGDWGVAEKFVDKEQARQHLIQILAFWWDSPEANFIKNSLRWSAEEQKTMFPNFPLQNETVVGVEGLES